MKDKLEAKLGQLNENKVMVQNQISEGTKLLRKAEADLNAIMGAIQVVNQLLDENADNGKTKETKKDGKES